MQQKKLRYLVIRDVTSGYRPEIVAQRYEISVEQVRQWVRTFRTLQKANAEKPKPKTKPKAKRCRPPGPRKIYPSDKYVSIEDSTQDQIKHETQAARELIEEGHPEWLVRKHFPLARI